MQAMEIRLLGPPLVRLGKEILSLGPKAAALVAYLAVEGISSRERVLGQLWPESSQKKAQGSLRYLLHSLRKSVSDLIDTDTQSLALNEGARVDILQLSQASTPSQRSAAAELCRGHFCEGLQGGSPEFDDWLEKQRLHWGQTVVENLLQLARLLEPKEGLKPARQAVLLDPVNETAHATIIELLVKLGELAEAHRQYERCRESLWEELGVEPTAATAELLTQQPEPVRGSNLPASITELIGRESCLRQLEKELGQHRIVTLSGEGGIGKTTLALEAARGFKEGRSVWWVELAKLTDQNDLEKEVGAACGLADGGDLASHLATAPSLLLLDNCEHILGDAAKLSARLLHSCPELRILATSREPLRVDGEKIMPLDPLELPSEVERDPGSFPAVKLFLERARQAGATDAMLSESSQVAEICRKLDGLPLAIELAAARARTLSPSQLLEGLEQRFRLLKNRKSTAENRQKTLSALIDWSYQRLDDEDRAAFRHLSVFRSGFYVESASELLGLDSWDTADHLERLVEKSLLRTRAQGGGLRYYFLESLRDFGWFQLEKADELRSLQRRHLDHFLQLAQSLCPLTKGQQQRVWLDKLDSELGNFRAALSYALVNEPSKGLNLAAALCPLWKDRDHREEGLEVLEKALGSTEKTDQEWPRGLLLRGELNIQLARCEEAIVFLEESLAMGRERDDCQVTGRAAKGLGTAHFFLRQFELSLNCFEKAREEYERLNDPFEVANCINNLGLAELYRNNLERADSYFVESFAIHQKAGSLKGEGVAVGNRAYVAEWLGDSEKAHTLFLQSLKKLHQVGALWNSAYFLEGLSRTLFSLGKSEEAVRCLAVADGLRAKLKTPRLPVEAGSYQELLESLRSTTARFNEVWAGALSEDAGFYLQTIVCDADGTRTS
jgi:predicted ATPase/DNA-binding SARP family transcriptional activator